MQDAEISSLMTVHGACMADQTADILHMDTTAEGLKEIQKIT